MSNKNFLYLTLLTFAVVIIWAGVSAYAHFRQSTIPPDIEKIMEPINPNLDRTVFDKLQGRQK